MLPMLMAEIPDIDNIDSINHGLKFGVGITIVIGQ